MRSGLIAALAALLVSGPLQPARAQSDTIVSVIKIGAWAQVLAERCSSLEVDWSRYGTMMTMAGLRPQDIEPEGKHGSLHRAFIKEALTETKASPETVICASGLTLYGPSGRNMPNLLARKK